MHKTKGLILVLTIGLLLSGCGTGSTSEKSSHKSSSKVTASTTSKRSNSTSSTSTQSTNPKLSTKQQTAYNDTMSHALAQDQKEAKQGKKMYQWSKYVQSISYDIDNGYIVKVGTNFQQLNTASKTSVANHAQSFAQSQLIMIGKNIKATSPAPYLVFKSDSTTIGHSKKSVPTEFDFTK